MNRLVIIDGNAVLHRAYHAIPPLTAPDGSVVNAVYGFTTMLLRIFHDLAPTHIAVAFDRPVPTFRKKMYKEYQATRPKMDDELAGQIDRVHALVRAFGIPIYEKDGFEADDVIGTLARDATTQRRNDAAMQRIDQVIIVTGDRDILQLVDDKTYVYMPTKGLSEAKLYMDKDVKERLGVDAKHITDYKGFAGDSSDNYPGVDGIGPKTAIDLIDRFGSVEGVYAFIKKHKLNHESGIVNHEKGKAQISPNVLKKLIDGEKNAILSKDLATIRTDVSIGGEVQDARVETLNTPEARKFLEDLHFHSLLKRLSGDTRDVRHDKKEKTNPADKAKADRAGEQQELF